MNEQNWQARAEAAERELERVRTLNNELLTRSSSDAFSRAEFAERELDRVRKACGEMRDMLTYLKRDVDRDGIPEEIDSMNLVLSTDAGKEYHHRDEFKPLVLAIEKLKTALSRRMPMADPEEEPAWQSANKALAEARAKGLIL